MTESSLPWDGDTGGEPAAAGDAGPYSSNDWDDLYHYLAGEGVLPGVDDELAVSGTSSPVSVAAGAALVNGKFYHNTAALNVAVPTPVASTRIDRIVLRADYTAQTVRAVRLAGSEGGAAPALTQSDGVTWEISLAQVSITTGGVTTVTSERTAADQGRLPGEITMLYVSSVDGSKHPVRDGLTYDGWYLCDGNTYNGRATPNMADRLPIGVGTIAAAQGTTAGAETHTHADGTLANDTVANHVHAVSITTGYENATVPGGTGGEVNAASYHHTHVVSGNVASAGTHTHTISGDTAAGSSLPPVIGVRWFMYSPS